MEFRNTSSCMNGRPLRCFHQFIAAYSTNGCFSRRCWSCPTIEEEVAGLELATITSENESVVMHARAMCIASSAFWKDPLESEKPRPNWIPLDERKSLADAWTKRTCPNLVISTKDP